MVVCGVVGWVADSYFHNSCGAAIASLTGLCLLTLSQPPIQLSQQNCRRLLRRLPRPLPPQHPSQHPRQPHQPLHPSLQQQLRPSQQKQQQHHQPPRRLTARCVMWTSIVLLGVFDTCSVCFLGVSAAGTRRRESVEHHAHARADNCHAAVCCTLLRCACASCCVPSPQVPANVLEARQWIANWRAKQGKGGAPPPAAASSSSSVSSDNNRLMAGMAHPWLQPAHCCYQPHVLRPPAHS